MSIDNHPTAAQRTLWRVVADMNLDKNTVDINRLKPRLEAAGCLDFRKGEGEASLAAVMLEKMEAGILEGRVARVLMETLIEGGLNPLLEPNAVRRLFNGQALCHEEAGQWLVQALARAEMAGRPLRGTMGETIAHLVATSIDARWSDTRLADMDDPAWAGKTWPAWINAQDALGQTPLHRCIAAFTAGGEYALWIHIQMLGMMSVEGNALRLDIPDHQGRCAWQRLLEISRQPNGPRIMPGLRHHLLVHEARWLDQAMEAGTPQAAKREGRGVRL